MTNNHQDGERVYVSPEQMQAIADQSGADERAKFERWIRSIGGNSDYLATCEIYGRYKHMSVQNSWDAWQAALASTHPAPVTAQEPIATVKVTNSGYGMMLSTYVAYALPEGFHGLYATPQPFPAPAVQSGELPAPRRYFHTLPLGTTFSYIGSDEKWIVLETHGCGLVAKYAHHDSSKPLQQICSFEDSEYAAQHTEVDVLPLESIAQTAPAVAMQAGLPYGIVDPDYARIFTMARVLAWSEGYAITMHGSFTRDLYLLAVPWADRVCEPEHPPSEKPHGRLAWTPLYALQSQQSPVQASDAGSQS